MDENHFFSENTKSSGVPKEAIPNILRDLLGVGRCSSISHDTETEEEKNSLDQSTAFEKSTGVVESLRNILWQADVAAKQEPQKTRSVNTKEIVPESELSEPFSESPRREEPLLQDDQPEFVFKEDILRLLKRLSQRETDAFSKTEILESLQDLVARARPVSDMRESLDASKKDDALSTDSPEIRKLEELINIYKQKKE